MLHFVDEIRNLKRCVHLRMPHMLDAHTSAIGELGDEMHVSAAPPARPPAGRATRNVQTPTP